MLFVLSISHLMNVSTYGAIIARAAVDCRFGLRCFTFFTCAVFNSLSMKPVKSVYCSVIKDMLVLGRYSGLSSAHHGIFTTFNKQSLHFTRSRGIPEQNYLTGLIDFFHGNKALL